MIPVPWMTKSNLHASLSYPWLPLPLNELLYITLDCVFGQNYNWQLNYEGIELTTYHVSNINLYIYINSSLEARYFPLDPKLIEALEGMFKYVPYIYCITTLPKFQIERVLGIMDAGLRGLQILYNHWTQALLV